MQGKGVIDEENKKRQMTGKLTRCKCLLLLGSTETSYDAWLDKNGKLNKEKEML